MTDFLGILAGVFFLCGGTGIVVCYGIGLWYAPKSVLDVRNNWAYWLVFAYFFVLASGTTVLFTSSEAGWSPDQRTFWPWGPVAGIVLALAAGALFWGSRRSSERRRALMEALSPGKRKTLVVLEWAAPTLAALAGVTNLADLALRL
jgi:hypothetical protein